MPTPPWAWAGLAATSPVNTKRQRARGAGLDMRVILLPFSPYRASIIDCVLVSMGPSGRLPLPLSRRHRVQELAVGLGLGQPLQHQLHGLDRGERVQDLAQDPDPVQLLLGEQQFLLAGPPALDVDGGEEDRKSVV